MTRVDRAFKAYSVLGLAGFLGGGSLLLFASFLYSGPLRLVDLRLTETAGILFDICLCFSFFIQHSVMIRRRVKRRITLFIPDEFYAAFYAIISGLVLTIQIVFWQESAHTLMELHGILRLLFRGAFFFSIFFAAWSLPALRGFDPLGLNPVLDHLRGTTSSSPTLAVRGPFRLVRHPLYFSTLLMIWSFPVITLDRLLFNVLFTVYIIIGAFLEERDLVVSFGETYLNYKAKTPMLLPYRTPQSSTGISGEDHYKATS